MSIDTVSDLPRRVQYVASAAQTSFDYPFPIFTDADLTVDVDGVVAALNTDYTVAGEGDDTGGTITWTGAALTGGEIVTIYSDMVIERLTDVAQNGPWSSSAYNDEQDKTYLILRELKDKIERCLRIPITAEVDDDDIELSVAAWANMYVTIDANGKPTPAALSATTITASVIGQLLYPESDAETAASVSPSSLGYKPGDVRRYGAVGNNSTDCTTAFQAAIDQMAQAGAEVFIPAGTWRITSTLAGARGISMVGEGRYVSIVRVIGAVGFYEFTGTSGNPDGSALVFRNFTVKGSATSDDLVSLTTAGQAAFRGMRFWLSGANCVSISNDCHRVSFDDCLFQSWAGAAIYTELLVSIFSVTNCQFNIVGGDAVTQLASSACISLGTGEHIHIQSCNTNGDDTLYHFIRIRDDVGRVYIGECYSERTQGANIRTDDGVVISGAVIQNCNVSCADSIAVELSTGDPAHSGLFLRNLRRPELVGKIVDFGANVTDFDYAGTPLDGAADHVQDYAGYRSVRKFIDGSVRLGSQCRMTIGPWSQDNVTGTVGNTELSGTRWVATRAGRITGVVVKATEARTAGTLTVNVFKNTGLSGAAGAAVGLSATLDGTNTSKKASNTQSVDSAFAFAAGDELYVVYSTSGWTPTTSDIRVFVEVEA